MKFMQNSQALKDLCRNGTPPDAKHALCYHVFFDAGGGHRNASEALKTTLQEDGWDVHTLNVQELLDSIDFIRGLTGLRIQDGYHLILRKGWIRLSPPLLRTFD
jgi:hypothetical protein